MAFSVKMRPFATNDIELHARGTVLRAAAEAAARQLKRNISAGPRSGKRIGKGGRPVSVWPEFPQFQTGELSGWIDVRRAGRLGYAVGFFDATDQRKLNEIEFAPPSRGGRAPLARTLEAEETRELMAAAIAVADKL